MNNKVTKPLQTAIVAAMIGLGSATVLLPNTGMAQNAPAAPVPTSTAVTALPDFTSIVAATENAVVNIRTMEKISSRPMQGFGPGDSPEDLFRFFFGPDFMPPRDRDPRSERSPRGEGEERSVPRGVGSGFIISKDGYIMTNNHVVDGASKITVTMNDGREYQAKVIGTDKRTDIALIKIQADNLPVLKIGDSNRLKKGQWVLAIGSPFGLDSTVTSGIVSAINRDTGEYLPFIQTDVAVNPGNSGGPLINLSGEVVGINSQIISQSGGFMGISLSIPIDEAMRVVEQLKATGKVTRGRIGVQIGEVSEEVAKAIGLPKAAGALVSNVEQGGPADKAGVQAGDVITKFNGAEVKKWSDLPRLVGQTKPESDSSLEVWRRGKYETLMVKIAEIPSAPSDTANSNEPQEQAGSADRLGLIVEPVPSSLQSRMHIKGGVLVKDVKGAALEASIQPGDVILALNNQDVKDVQHFREIVGKLEKGKAAALLVRRDNLTQWVPVTPAK